MSHPWLMPRGTLPLPGDIGLVIDAPKDHAHHTFLVTVEKLADHRFGSFEGNTNPGGGREGYGCFDRTTRRMGGLTVYEFIRLPWPDRAMIDHIISLERSYSWVRESDGPNDSKQIRIFQKFTGNAPPDSWCMSFQQYCLHQVWKDCPLRISASCQQVRVSAALLKVA